MKMVNRVEKVRQTFGPLAIGDVVRGFITVFICCIVDVIPKYELIARI